MQNSIINLFKKSILILLFISAHSVWSQIAITELNYHSDSLNSSGDWIELHNYSGQTVDISGWTLRDGNAANPPYAFPSNTQMAAGSYIVLAENAAKFGSIHTGITLSGVLPFEFSNNSEQITLRDAANLVKIQFTYGDSTPWNKCADGQGRTLEILSPQLDPNLASSWRCGCVLGSPKAARSACINETVVVSEINYNSLTTQDPGDWIELRNTSNAGINISGWKMRDKNNYNVYTFPANTILNPFARIVVYADAAKFSNIHPTVLNKVGPFTFGFSANGDGIRLYNAQDKIRFSTYYNDNILWPQGADGQGLTLELDTNFTNDMDVCSPLTWFGGCFLGTPGKSFMYCADLSSENIESLEIEIYPNPTQDYLTISSFEEVEVFDNTGRHLYTKKQQYNSLGQINLEAFPSGMYILKIRSEGRVWTHKIIKN